MTTPISVLACASAGYRITEALHRSGFGTPLKWTLPDGHPADAAAFLAASAADTGYWTAPLSESTLIITAFDTSAASRTVVIPHVLPYLARGTTLIQMGILHADDAEALAEAADIAGVRLVHTPLLSPEAHSTPTPQGPAPRQVDTALTRALALAAALQEVEQALDRPQAPATTAAEARILAEMEAAFADVPVSTRRYLGLDPLPEEALAEIEGLADRPYRA